MNILAAIFWIILNYKPVTILPTKVPSCGAARKMMREKVQIALGDRQIKVNKVEWGILGGLEAVNDELLRVSEIDTDNWGWGWAVRNRTVEMLFNESEAYLSIQGVDYKRRPCQDVIRLKRIR